MVKDPNKAKRFCSICTKHLNVKNPYVQCSNCEKYSHISCININYPNVQEILKSYNWECHLCKKCSICHSANDTKTNLMLLCDRCDKGFHMRCLNPPLKKKPEEGKLWLCNLCENELKELDNNNNDDDNDNNSKENNETKIEKEKIKIEEKEKEIVKKKRRRSK